MEGLDPFDFAGRAKLLKMMKKTEKKSFRRRKQYPRRDPHLSQVTIIYSFDM